MSPNGDAGDGTYRTVRDRHSAWREDNPPKRSRTAIRFPEPSDAALRLAGTAVGVGTGVGLLVLAVIAFMTASGWSAIDRDGAAVAYTLTGFFLSVAGVGAIVATINHNYRVVFAEPEHH